MASVTRRAPVSSTTTFNGFSVTKTATAVAVLQLVEQGKLSLDDPASRWIRSFEHTKVATPGANGEGLAIAEARRPITIRDLLTHTAGIPYGDGPPLDALYEPAGLGPAAGYGWYLADKDEALCTTMERLGTLPFEAQPGERFVYGYSTDVLGCIVERVSGLSLDEYFRSRITGPSCRRTSRTAASSLSKAWLDAPTSAPEPAARTVTWIFMPC